MLTTILCPAWICYILYFARNEELIVWRIDDEGYNNSMRSLKLCFLSLNLKDQCLQQNFPNCNNNLEAFVPMLTIK